MKRILGRTSSMTRAVAVAITLAVVAAAPARAADKVVLAMAVDSFQYSLLYLAMDGGGFEHEGLEPDIVRFSSGSKQSTAVMSGNADFGPVGITHCIRAVAAGGPLRAISRNFDTLDYYVFLSNDAVKKTGITPDMSVDEKVKRLKGLRIGISGPGSGTDTTIRSLFMARGLDPDRELQLQPLGAPAAMTAAIAKGATDGFVYPAPYPNIAEQKGLGKVVIDPFNDKIQETQDILYQVIGASDDVIKNKPELMNKFLRAMAMGIKLLHDDPARARSIVAARLTNVDEDLFNILWPSYVKGIPDSLVVTNQQLDSTEKWLNLTSKEPVTQAYSDVVRPDAAAKASKEILGM